MIAQPIDRLARALSVNVEQLPVRVRALPTKQLLQLVDDTIDELHRRDAPKLRPLVAFVDHLPAGTIAAVAERQLPPRLAARLAGHLPAANGQALVLRLAPAYLAATAVHLELPRCGPLLASLPPQRIAAAAAAAELIRGDHFATTAAVAAHLTDPALAASIAALDDGAVRATAAHSDLALLDRICQLLATDRRELANELSAAKA